MSGAELKTIILTHLQHDSHGLISVSGLRVSARCGKSGVELKLTRGRFLTGFLRLADGRRVWFPGTILPAETHAETFTLNANTALPASWPK